VFAPTDEAFEAAAKAFNKADGKALVDFLYDNDLLTPVLLYHVAQGDRRAQGVVSSGQIKMLDGNWAAISVGSQGASIDGAPIVSTDLLASNGIIHVIGGVMLPPSFGE
jgi:transforming growth factor-beta-induced protein